MPAQDCTGLSPLPAWPAAWSAVLSRILSIEYVFPSAGDSAAAADPAYTAWKRSNFIVARVRLLPVALHTGFTAPSAAGGSDGGDVLWEAPRLSRSSALADPYTLDVTPKVPDCLVLRPRYEACMRRWGACWGDDAALGSLAGAPCLTPFLHEKMAPGCWQETLTFADWPGQTLHVHAGSSATQAARSAAAAAAKEDGVLPLSLHPSLVELAQGADRSTRASLDLRLTQAAAGPGRRAPPPATRRHSERTAALPSIMHEIVALEAAAAAAATAAGAPAAPAAQAAPPAFKLRPETAARALLGPSVPDAAARWVAVCAFGAGSAALRDSEDAARQKRRDDAAKGAARSAPPDLHTVAVSPYILGGAFDDGPEAGWPGASLVIPPDAAGISIWAPEFGYGVFGPPSQPQSAAPGGVSSAERCATAAGLDLAVCPLPTHHLRTPGGARCIRDFFRFHPGRVLGFAPGCTAGGTVRPWESLRIYAPQAILPDSDGDDEEEGEGGISAAAGAAARHASSNSRKRRGSAALSSLQGDASAAPRPLGPADWLRALVDRSNRDAARARPPARSSPPRTRGRPHSDAAEGLAADVPAESRADAPVAAEAAGVDEGAVLSLSPWEFELVALPPHAFEASAALRRLNDAGIGGDGFGVGSLAAAARLAPGGRSGAVHVEALSRGWPSVATNTRFDVLPGIPPPVGRAVVDAIRQAAAAAAAAVAREAEQGMGASAGDASAAGAAAAAAAAVADGCAEPFLDPVETSVPGYHATVALPMHLGCILQRLLWGYYRQAAALRADLALVVDNCAAFNGEDAPLTGLARRVYAQLCAALDAALTAAGVPVEAPWSGGEQAHRAGLPRSGGRGRTSSDVDDVVRGQGGRIRGDGEPGDPDAGAAASARPRVVNSAAAAAAASAAGDPGAMEDLAEGLTGVLLSLQVRASWHDYVLPPLLPLPCILPPVPPQALPSAEWFAAPISPSEGFWPEYCRAIVTPMDYGTIADRVRGGEYSALGTVDEALDAFARDLAQARAVGKAGVVEPPSRLPPPPAGLLERLPLQRGRVGGAARCARGAARGPPADGRPPEEPRSAPRGAVAALAAVPLPVGAAIVVPVTGRRAPAAAARLLPPASPPRE